MKNIGDSRSVLFSVSYQTFTTNLGEKSRVVDSFAFLQQVDFLGL